MVHPSNKRRHVDPGAGARPPPGAQPAAYAPMDVDAAAAASPATTLGAPTPPVVATPPPAVKVQHRRRCQVVACSAELTLLCTAAHWQCCMRGWLSAPTFSKYTWAVVRGADMLTSLD